MNVRSLACMTAAGFLGVLLVSAAAQPANSQASRDVVVQAQTNPDVLTATVNFRINDIRSLAGQQALIRRVRQATYEVCPEYVSGFTTDSLYCRGLAWAGAKPQIDRAIKRAMTLADTGAPMNITIGIIAAK
jgi:UrcA family protein